jgi:hypothetical protein
VRVAARFTGVSADDQQNGPDKHEGNDDAGDHQQPAIVPRSSRGQSDMALRTALGLKNP